MVSEQEAQVVARHGELGGGDYTQQPGEATQGLQKITKAHIKKEIDGEIPGLKAGYIQKQNANVLRSNCDPPC